MKHRLERLGLHVGVFGIVLAFLSLLLVLGTLVPNTAVYANYEKSARYYREAEPFGFAADGQWTSITDNYADGILLDVSWHMGEGESPLVRALDTDYYDGEAEGDGADPYGSIVEGKAPNADYTRYWHGGALVLRLLHLVTDVHGVKVIGFLLTLCLIGVTVLLLIRRGHMDLAVLLILALAAVQVWNIRLCLEYQTAFIITFALCPAYLWLEKKGDGWLTLLSTAGGVLIAFFDFLTTETLTLLIPLMLVTAVRAREGRLASFGQSLRLLAACALGWGAAYIGTFAVKWTAATLVTGENAFVQALTSAAVRVGVVEAVDEIAPSGFQPAITANLTMLFGGSARVQPVRAAVGSLLSLGAAASVWYLFRTKTPEKQGSLLVLILGAVVFVRFLLLNNHSFLHVFFTYRALAAPVLALLMALRMQIALPGKKRGRKKWS